MTQAELLQRIEASFNIGTTPFSSSAILTLFYFARSALMIGYALLNDLLLVVSCDNAVTRTLYDVRVSTRILQLMTIQPTHNESSMRLVHKENTENHLQVIGTSRHHPDLLALEHDSTINLGTGILLPLFTTTTAVSAPVRLRSNNCFFVWYRVSVHEKLRKSYGVSGRSGRKSSGGL